MSETIGLQLTVDAAPAAQGAREFQRSAEQIAQSSKQAGDGVKGLNDQLKSVGGGAKESLAGIESALGSLNSAFRLLGAGAVVGGLGELLSQAAELEDAFVKLQIVSGATDEALGQMEETARNLSNAFGVDQIKVAQVELAAASRGFRDVADNAAVVTAALELSSASFEDAGKAGQVLTQIMAAFHQPASEANEVAGILHETFKQAGVSLNEFGREAQVLAPTLQKAGVSMQQFSETLILLKENGIEGFRAMGPLRALFNSIGADSGPAAKAFEFLVPALHAAGSEATTFKALVAEQGGVIQALQKMKEVTAGVPAEMERAVGGITGMQAASALLSSTLKQQEDATKGLQNATKDLDDDNKKALDTFGKQADILKENVLNALKSVAGVLEQAMIPALKVLNQHAEAVTLVLTAFAGVVAIKTVASLASIAGGFLKVGEAATGLGGALSRAFPLLAAFTVGVAAGTAVYDKWGDSIGRVIDKLTGVEAAAKRATASTPGRAANQAPTVNDLHEITISATRREIEPTAAKPAEAQESSEVATALDNLIASQLKEKTIVGELAALHGQLSAVQQANLVVTGGRLLLEQELTSQLIKSRDAHQQYQLALKGIEAANDPVKKALFDQETAVRKLGEAYDTAKGQIGAHNAKVTDPAYRQALADEVEKGKEASIQAQAKVAELVAVDDAQKALITTTAAQNVREAQAAYQYSESKISLQQYNAILEDSAAKKLKAVVATEALTQAQKKLVDAELAQAEAGRVANASGLTGDQRARFLNEQAASFLKTLPLGGPDKTALTSSQAYTGAVEQLDGALKANLITVDQYNQALLEQKQQLNSAQKEYDTYTQIVLSAGKGINTGLTGLLDSLAQRGTTLRSIFSNLAQTLYKEAAQILSQKLEQTAFSGLANSANSALSSIGQNLASGAGVKLLATQGAAKAAADTGLSAASGSTLTAAGTSLTAAATQLSLAAAQLQAAAATSGSSGVSSAISGAASSSDASYVSDIVGALGYPTGGSPKAGSSALVGERGPEIVTFGHDSTVHSTESVRAAVGAAKSPQVNVAAPNVNVPVSVVNVRDPNEIPTAMGGADGTKAILNVISRNSTAVKSSLG